MNSNAKRPKTFMPRPQPDSYPQSVRILTHCLRLAVLARARAPMHAACSSSAPLWACSGFMPLYATVSQFQSWSTFIDEFLTSYAIYQHHSSIVYLVLVVFSKTIWVCPPLWEPSITRLVCGGNCALKIDCGFSALVKRQNQAGR